MPITRGAKKANRASARRQVTNTRRKDVLKAAIKGYRALISAKKLDEARAKLPSLYQAIDKAAKRGVIKRNTADRKKSRLSVLVGK